MMVVVKLIGDKEGLVVRVLWFGLQTDLGGKIDKGGFSGNMMVNGMDLRERM